jgi:hypothetical protein
MADAVQHRLVPEEEKELVMRIIKYVKTHHRATLTQIKEALELDQTDYNFMAMVLVKRINQRDNPNHILAFANRPDSNNGEDYREDEYQLVPTAVFSYVDYLEIKEARAQAAEAKNLSLLAIQIAVWSLILSSFIGLFGIFVQIVLSR